MCDDTSFHLFKMIKELMFKHGGEGRLTGSNLHICTLSWCVKHA
jgi:hypothetical protein